jgi:hypothetical protein
VPQYALLSIVKKVASSLSAPEKAEDITHDWL